MSLRHKFKEVTTINGGLSWGARIAGPDDEPLVDSPLPAATRELIDWASGFWPQANPDDFEWGIGRRGMGARHRETGAEYTLRSGLPIGGELASGISTWCLRQGRLCLLADRADRPIFQGVPTALDRPRSGHVGPPADDDIAVL